MTSDKIFLGLQILGLLLGLLITDGGVILVVYLVALAIPNLMYYCLHRRYSSGPIHVLLVISPLLMFFILLFIMAAIL